MHTRSILRLLSLFTACAVFGTGCSLFAPEEVSHVITIETEATYDYELTSVTRGDVTTTRTIYCTYTQKTDAALSFGTAGLPVRYVYVSPGDTVSEGDLLAKLDTASIESEYASLSYTIDRTNLLKKQANELWAFDLAALKTSYKEGEIDRAAYDASKESIDNTYTSMISGYDDTLYIDQLRLARIEEQLAGSAIYATMDGTVSEIEDLLLDRTSVAGKVVITVIDATNCAFMLNDDSYAEYFAAGDTVLLSDTAGNSYETVVAPSDDGTIYMELVDPSIDVTVGTKVNYALVTDSVKDVLMLPKNAVHTVGDSSYVYTEDENGLKSISYITIGVVGSTYTEIKDGLAEGDAVILR